jgi:copper chaperone CopZ
MSNSKMVIALMLFFAIFTNTTLNAQSKNKQTETFKVWGNCGMCEKTIEKSLKVKGISSAEWNKDSKIITVVFNPKIITLTTIHKKIASVGYDTELETANDEVYKNLHGCCQYERKNK